MEKSQENEMLSLADAAKLSGIPRRTLTGAAIKGLLKTIRKRPWMTTKEALQEYQDKVYIPRPRD